MGVQSDVVLPARYSGGDRRVRIRNESSELKEVMAEVPWRFDHFGAEILQVIRHRK